MKPFPDPNPPGSININNTTTNSISIVWAPAPWMENSDDFNYTVTISNSPLPREFNTKITSQDLTDLTPGTFYNISVRTTGPLGFQSERVVKNAFTSKCSIQVYRCISVYLKTNMNSMEECQSWHWSFKTTKILHITPLKRHSHIDFHATEHFSYI